MSDIETLRQNAIRICVAAGYTGWPTDPGFLRPTPHAMYMLAGWIERDAQRTSGDEQRRYLAALDAVRILGRAVMPR